MKLDAITIHQMPGEQESLALSMRAVAAASGSELDYDAFCAALGISLAAVAHTAETSPAGWTHCARDLFFEETVRLFGWSARDLHPPDVGLDMRNAQEYPQHFELSYKPLICRALEHGQPVLAWCGWEGAACSLWGVITALQEGEFWGVAPGHAGPVRLAAPAAQCYVIEHHEPRTPANGDLFVSAIAHTREYLDFRDVRLGSRRVGLHGLLTGSAAYEVWSHWLTRQAPGSAGDGALAAHREYARCIALARLSAARFFTLVDAPHGPDHAALADGIVGCCFSAAGELLPSYEADLSEALWRTADGHEVLLDSLHSARAADEQIADWVRQLARNLAAAPAEHAVR